MSRETKAAEQLQKASRNRKIIYAVAIFAAICVIARTFTDTVTSENKIDQYMTLLFSGLVMAMIFGIVHLFTHSNIFNETSTQRKKNANIWAPTASVSKATRMVPNNFGEMEPAENVAGTIEWHQKTNNAKKSNKKDNAEVPFMKNGHLPKPKELFDAMGEYVIGQEDARRTLSIAVYNHYKRVNNIIENGEDDIQIAKSNILILGPTGTGKTLMVQTLARILNVPLAITDATSLTDAGYVGEDVESIDRDRKSVV